MSPADRSPRRSGASLIPDESRRGRARELARAAAGRDALDDGVDHGGALGVHEAVHYALRRDLVRA